MGLSRAVKCGLVSYGHGAEYCVVVQAAFNC
jgi:hypothetical protein